MLIAVPGYTGAVMSTLFDCGDSTQLLAGMRQARQAIGRGELIVMPTDTVYGVAADAFTPAAVTRLLEAKGRGRQSPPPVLVSGRTMMQALVSEIPEAVDRLVEAFWPGGLTIVLPAQPSLSWDLGDTHGTVAVRMPDQPFALELIEETGPLAVSSANLTGQPAATTAADAQRMLGDSITVYLDAGDSRTGVASTIVDATALVGDDGVVHVLRDGAVSRDRLREVLGDLLESDDDGAAPHAVAETATASDAVPTGAASDDTAVTGGSGTGDAAAPGAASAAIEDADVVIARPFGADVPDIPAVPAADVAATGGGEG